MSFESFLQALSSAIPKVARAIPVGLGGGAASIRKHYRVPGISESQAVVSFLQDDADHVYQGMPISGAPSKDFYFGRDLGWAGIAENLDVRRRISDSVMIDAILREERKRHHCCDLYVLKGPAGNGKSIALKRLAWDAASEFDKIVIFVKTAGAIKHEALADLFGYCQERVFLFVDRAAVYASEIRGLMQVARSQELKLTIITAERDNEWNMRCGTLEEYLEQDYPVRYLSEDEITDLLGKLEHHDALGVLKDASHQQRITAFVERAQRQLLVALHEATAGKRFEDILMDEYNRIIPTEARQLYLDVCTLHRLGVGVRAGLISRISKIRFIDFQTRFLEPLEHVVQVYRDKYIDDMMYQSRHSHVAEIVFYGALEDAEERFDQIIGIIQEMNIGYSSDMTAFREITNGKKVLETFRQSIDLGRRLYDVAEDLAGDNAYLFQQRAEFEMDHREGDLAVAERALDRAVELAPYDPSIQHSCAVLARNQAQASVNPLLRAKYRRTARERLQAVTGPNARRPHGFHTAALLYLDELKDALGQAEVEGPDAGGERPMVNFSRDVEQVIARGLQKFPEDGFLLQVQSEYLDLISRHQRAEEALQKAFAKNPRHDWIAVLLSRRLAGDGRIEDAKVVLKQALEEMPASKQAHLALAHLYMRSESEEEKRMVLGHLAASFIDGDTNYDAQFWYARELFLRGEYEQARKYFGKLKAVTMPGPVRNQLRGIVRDGSGKAQRLEGAIIFKEEAYLFVKPDDFQADVYGDSSETSGAVWKGLQQGARVTFELGFTMNPDYPYGLSFW